MNLNQTTKAIIPPGASYGEKSNSPKPSPALLDADLIDALPYVLREGVHLLVEPNDKQVFLVSALALLSGVTPNIQGVYDGKLVSPQLYVFIIGDYGTGKGGASFARHLLAPIEDELEREYERNCKAWAALDAEERKGSRPQEVGLVIAANSSASAFIQTLADNGGKGIMCETEGDTLAQTLASDHGKYSDVLRKCFHHEPVSMTRRDVDRSAKIKRPELAVLLTGTPDQQRRLTPNVRNGLFSRFLYLTIEPETSFRNVFDPSKASYEDEFKKLGVEVYQLYTYLKGLDEHIIFCCTKEQEEAFVAYYRKKLPIFLSATGQDAFGVFTRLALIHFRVAMLLSTLRIYHSLEELPERIVCTDKDFTAALRITEILTEVSLDVYHSFPDSKESLEADEPASEAEKLGAELVRSGMSIRDAARHAKVSKSKLHRYCKSLGVKSGNKGGTPTHKESPLGRWDSETVGRGTLQSIDNQTPKASPWIPSQRPIVPVGNPQPAILNAKSGKV
ncbi:hypothetical protein GGR26_001929 [Lewinella marina]|uniref:DUF3987 domain-containing protein n=1 Tax=Neolewinella marina TaxID=438751 RepID=A0A2G0CHB6_9BACT|nr:DUF3987 domain-containing protein [Neolewinella marina]NJB86161.1 hypothetical protein [Neolewinella marina]PHK99361.1 hypothetical protein CGL56_07880 [Neolewinella marina]